MASQPHVVAGPVNQGPRTQILPAQRVVYARPRILSLDGLNIEAASHARLCHINLCDLIKTFIYLVEGLDVAQTYFIERELWRENMKISNFDKSNTVGELPLEYRWWVVHRKKDAASIEEWRYWKLHRKHAGRWCKCVVLHIDQHDNWIPVECLEGFSRPSIPEPDFSSKNPEVVEAMSCFLKLDLLKEIIRLHTSSTLPRSVKQSSEDSLSDNYIKEVDDESS